MNTDGFDDVFGKVRGAASPGSPETDLAEMRAWLARWVDDPDREVFVIEHVGKMVEVKVEVSVGNSDRVEHIYDRWLPSDSPAGAWLLEMVKRGEAQQFGGWDLIPEVLAAIENERIALSAPSLTRGTGRPPG